MSEAKARELLTMAAKALHDLFNLKQDGRGHLIDWNLVAQKAERIGAYLAAVPAPREQAMRAGRDLCVTRRRIEKAAPKRPPPEMEPA